MAYIPTDDEQNQEAGMNVLSNSGQPQSPQNPQNPNEPQVSGTSSNIESQSAPQQVGSNAQPSGPSQPKGSGMFTDIRKYIQANQGAGQNIAGAVVGGVQKDASKIGQQIQEKQKQYQNQIAQQQVKQQQAQAFGQNLIQNAGQSGQPSMEDVQRFQNITGGQEQYNVGRFGTEQEKLSAENLARKAALTQRAQGVSNILRDTFGKQNQYTQGQQNLDAMLLGGDSGARQNIATQTKQTAQQVGQNLSQARQQALQGASDLAQGNKTLAETLKSGVSSSRDQLLSDVDAQVEQQRQGLAAEQQAFNQKLAAGTLTQEDLARFTDMKKLESDLGNYESLRKQALGNLYAYTGQGNLAQQFNPNIDPYWINRRYGTEYRASDLFNPNANIGYAGEGSNLAKQTSDILQKMGYDQGDIERAQLGLLGQQQQNFDAENAQAREAFKEQIRQDSRAKGANLSEQQLEQRVMNEFQPKTVGPSENIEAQAIINLLQPQQQNVSNVISELNKTQGLSLDDLKNLLGSDAINRSTAMNEAQFARQQALASLAGLGPEELIQRQAGPERAANFNVLEALRRYRKV